MSMKMTKGKSMPKQPTQAALTKPSPNFERGSVIAARSLVVDLNGVHWWVDPDSKTIKQI